MKKLFWVIGIGVVALVSCNSKKSDEAKEAAMQDSITIETLDGQKDSLMSLVGEINNNLLEVSRLEGVVTSKDFRSETPSQKQAVLANIEAIKQELATRREKLDQLEAKLKKSNGYSAELKKTIDTQKKLIDDQTQKIAALEDELAKANIKIEGLNTKVDSLNTTVSNVSKEKQAAEQRSEELNNQLNTCYYIAASNKVLKSKNILSKKFLGRTKILEGDFDRSAFTKADKRTLKEIPTKGKNVKIMSRQPANSYRIVEENGYKVIKILNPSLFWEKSDFLVIEVK